MANRDVKVVCPCCESVLEVDARVGSVIRWKRKDELDASGKRIVRESDWDDAASRAKERKSGAMDKFDASLTQERGREQSLDDLFDQAKKKQGDKPQDF
jgi:hypothetical protein